MSNPTASNQAFPPIDPKTGLMFTVASHLVPLFKTGPGGAHLARQMAISAIEAYHPETRADFVNLARTIAFSMAALVLLGRAVAGDMTIPEQMRAFGRANALNRSADQSERTMMQRRRYQQANPMAEQPKPPVPVPDTGTEADDAEMQEAVAGIMKEFRATIGPTNTEAVPPEVFPAPAPTPPKAVTPRPSHIVGLIQSQVAAPATAIHDTGPKPNAGQLRTAPYRTELLRNSAMQTVVGASVAQHPV